MQQVKAQNISSGSGYEVGQSLLFGTGGPRMLWSDKAITPTDNRKCTLSIWLKIAGSNTSGHQIVNANTLHGGGNKEFLQLQHWFNPAGSRIELYDFMVYTVPGFRWSLRMDQTFSDTASWYHLVVKYDSTQAVESDRVIFYVNGTEASIDTSPTYHGYPPLNHPCKWTEYSNAAGTLSDKNRSVGGNWNDKAQQYEGYASEVHLIDGQALGSEHFALTDSKGVYNPIPYTGTYGVGGFYLPFEASDIGADESGNGNDFTPWQFTSESLVADSPSNNYCTLNPNDKDAFVGGHLGGGNLFAGFDGVSATGRIRSTFPVTSIDKCYMEVELANDPGSRNVNTEIQDSSYSVDRNAGDTGGYNRNWANVALGKSIIVQVAFNKELGAIWFGYDGVWDNGATDSEISSGDTSNANFSGIPPATYCYRYVNQANADSNDATHNFGQRTFAHQPPSDYLPLCTQNLPDTLVNPKDHFSAVTYTGNGGTQSIDTGFEPGMVWTKERNQPSWHGLRDSVVGIDRSRSSNETDPDFTETDGITAFTSTGFDLSGDGFMYVNRSGEPYISWNFRGGGPAVTNNDGSIPTQVSANKDMGFSVVKWTQNLQQLYTIGHSLGKAPDLIIVKQLNAESWWPVYSKVTGPDSALFLNQSDKVANSNTWGSFNPTSEVFMFSEVAGDYIAYCFANTEMVQVGSYVGNGVDDGPFISLPFKPAFILWKNIDVAGFSWGMQDNKRDGYNPANWQLYASDAVAESTSYHMADLLSNGVKINGDGGATNNGAGNRILYLAIADQNFKHSRGR